MQWVPDQKTHLTHGKPHKNPLALNLVCTFLSIMDTETALVFLLLVLQSPMWQTLQMEEWLAFWHKVYSSEKSGTIHWHAGAAGCLT